MSKRQAVTKLCLETIAKMLPNGDNLKLYQKKFEDMDDKQFDAFMADLKAKNTRLVVVMPNGSKEKVDVGRNFEIARSLGREPFEQVWVPATQGARKYLTPIPYLVMPMPVRRQAQMVSKKISLPEDVNSVDHVTGQPTGKSKGAKVSAPEVKVLASMGLDKTLNELMSIRAGDAGGYRALSTFIERTGYASIEQIEPYRTGVKATQAMSHYLKAAHLSNNLV